MSSFEPVTSRRFVITGTSGSGKTCLLEALRSRGHPCFDEPVRKTLVDQLASDGPALPAKDPRLFLDEILRQCLSDLEASASVSGPAFFDRGIPDLVAYAIRFGVGSEEFEQAADANRYARSVFVLPPWKEIFVNDDLRRADFETYVGFHEMIEAAYRKSGYHLVEVPKLDIGSRVRFVEVQVAQSERGD